jgi:hypothetical protein
MPNPQFPPFCAACIRKVQLECPHTDTYWTGGFHYTGGEVWDDIEEVCCDCGAVLSELPSPISSQTEDDEPIPF